jgi:serine protease
MFSRLLLRPRWALLSVIMVALVFLIAPSASPIPPDQKPNPGKGSGGGRGDGGGTGDPAPPGALSDGGTNAQAAAAPSAGRASASSQSVADDTVLVGFQPGTSASEQATITRAARAIDLRTIGAGTHVLSVETGHVTEKIAFLKTQRGVRYAEPDYVVRADMTPNDRYYNKLWGLPKIQADKAWDVTTGSQNVVVGVVDTGIDYDHPDLAANVWSNNGSINGCAAGTHGYNALTLTCDPLDDHNHGTHVSGTIGAVGNNGIGVIGVNSSVKIVGLKFLNSGGSGSTSGAIAAIDWAVKAKIAGVNLRVLSNSWGGGGYSQALRDEIVKAGTNDILFVAAAGNYASNNDVAPLYPCSYGVANEICVAATDTRDSLASFSNYGPSSVDLSAPGVSILSTLRGGTYGTMSGTSMATPHVSGAAALALSNGYQSVATLKATILAAVDPIASQAGRTKTGGRLDVCKALPACSGVVPPPPPPPPPPTTGDFSIGASPSRQAVSAGASVSYTVAVTPSGGFTGLVALIVTGLPTGGSGSFAPTPLSVTSSTSNSSKLSLTTSATTPQANYTLTITAASGSLTHTKTVVLRVRRN